MSQTIHTRPLEQQSFAPFGEVLEAVGTPSALINQGNCERYSNLAKLDFDTQGAAGISLFHAKAYALPLSLTLVERHPLGSQAFLPMHTEPFLVIVCLDENGTPGVPQAFITNGSQGVNYHRNTWHGVLTPIKSTSLFTVVDWIGSANNLQEHHFDTPFTVVSS